MDELFFNNFSKIDGTNRFSINAGTYCVFSNLTFLFVWTNVYYSYRKMTPLLISDNRFLSSELDLRVSDMISTNAFSLMPRRQTARGSRWPCDVMWAALLEESSAVGNRERLLAFMSIPSSLDGASALFSGLLWDYPWLFLGSNLSLCCWAGTPCSESSLSHLPFCIQMAKPPLSFGKEHCKLWIVHKNPGGW